jgi:hypothetical protein
MKRAILMAAAFACATAVSTAAQTPSPSASKTDDKTVTVTGCLQDASATPAGSPAAAGFILANATIGSGATPSSSSTVGTTGTAGTAASARGTSYVLQGHDADLKSHVGHKIEVTGTVEPKSRTGASPDPAAAAPGAPASSMASERLTVSSVKMIAAECTAK